MGTLVGDEGNTRSVTSCVILCPLGTSLSVWSVLGGKRCPPFWWMGVPPSWLVCAGSSHVLRASGGDGFQVGGNSVVFLPTAWWEGWRLAHTLPTPSCAAVPSRLLSYHWGVESGGSVGGSLD